jgi:lysophospholipase L1-like esterase
MRIKFIHCCLTCLCLTSATPLLAVNPYRILVTGDSISVGYTDNPSWTVPYEFGFRSGLYTRLTNSGMSVQFVGNSPEPWDGKWGVPTNTPTLNLRLLDQDHCEGYGGKKASFILSNIQSWLTAEWPDIILLMIGINDIHDDIPEPTATEQTLSNIVYTVTANAPNARLIVAQITPYGTNCPGIVKYNSYIRNVLVPYFAAQAKHVTTVNQYTNMLFPGTTNIDGSLFANGINHPNAVVYNRIAQTWFQGIQALSLPPPGDPPVPPPTTMGSLTNGGFESPVFSSPSHNVNPAGTGWTFTAGASGAGSGIESGNPYGKSTNAVPYEGAQYAFLQGSGNSTTTRISRVISDFNVGQYYQVSFHSKGISGYTGANPFQVRMIDGARVVPLFGGNDIVPVLTNYTTYVSEPFRATSTNMTLDFSDHALSVATKVSWIDAVTISPVPAVSVNGFMDRSRFDLQFNGFTNISYTVIGTSDLTLPMENWPALGAAQWLSNNVFQFTDDQTSNHLQRFYRVRLDN